VFAQKGFSYIELVFTVAILAVLATAATPYLEKTIQRKKESELRTSLREIRRALDAYKAASDAGKIKQQLDESGYPTSLAELTVGIPDQTDPQKKPMYFIRRLPADPMYVYDAEREVDAVSAEDTWATRSYRSDAGAQSAGKDVYDVYSKSSAVGLNGIPYREW